MGGWVCAYMDLGFLLWQPFLPIPMFLLCQSVSFVKALSIALAEFRMDCLCAYRH